MYSDKADIFDFGVILLEVVSGKTITSMYEVDILGDRRRGPGQEEELRGPDGEQGLLRRVAEDGNGDLPEVPGQGASTAAFCGGRALEPAVRCPGAGRLGGGSLEQRRREPGVLFVQGHQVISAELEQMISV